MQRHRHEAEVNHVLDQFDAEFFHNAERAMGSSPGARLVANPAGLSRSEKSLRRTTSKPQKSSSGSRSGTRSSVAKPLLLKQRMLGGRERHTSPKRPAKSLLVMSLILPYYRIGTLQRIRNKNCHNGRLPCSVPDCNRVIAYCCCS